MRRSQIVLVVDDDPAIRRMLEVRLRRDQTEVLSAGSGAEAERIVDERGEAIDLILLDVGLPDAHGFELCRALRKRADMAETPIIFLTGFDSSEDTIRGFEAGGTDYVVKPFDPAVLHARVNAALRVRQLLHERAEAEATLRQNEHRYRHLTEHCVDMISKHDREGRYRDVSPACERLLGYRPDELIGRLAYDLIHPDDQSVVASHHRALLRNEPPQPVMFRGQSKDGSYIWLESMCRILPDSDGEIICVTRDVTVRKETTDAIRANEAKLQAITAQLPAIVWTTDIHLFIRSMYGSLLLDFDLDGALAIGKPLQDIAEFIAGHEDELIINAHRAAMQGESACARFVRDDRDFEVRVEPLLTDAGECTGCLCIAFDVTERRRIEEVERSRATLEEAIIAMEQVLGVIGHELRTPLTGLRVMSELLLSDQQATSEKEEFLTMIHNEVIRMASMVNDLLEAARINSGKAQWNWSTFDLTEVCHNALEIVRHTIDKRNVTFGVEVWSDDGQVNQPLMMSGDRDAIHRLFVNLLTNAEKHTREGVIIIKVNERIRDEERWIEIAIRDSGEGMPKHILEKLGVPFALNAGVIGERGVDDNPATRHGCGLGLAICKGIALAHGGQIRFDSQLGMGTTVHISMRADLNGPAQTQQHAIFVNEVSR